MPSSSAERVGVGNLNLHLLLRFSLARIQTFTVLFFSFFLVLSFSSECHSVCPRLCQLFSRPHLDLAVVCLTDNTMRTVAESHVCRLTNE